MKKLVCAKDIDELVKAGETVLYADSNTIITASAEDEAKAKGITISYDAPGTAACAAPAPAPAPAPEVQAAPAPAAQPAGDNTEISSELIYQVIRTMVEKGMLGEFFKNEAAPDAPYLCEKDPSGLKVVRGNTVRMDEFFEGNPRVTYQELIDKNDSNISSGLLIIDHDTYEWTQNYDENDYVIEGSMTVTINGRSYTANAGDCIFIPNGATVVMGSKDSCCKIFYNTYPSNWADLL